MKLNVSEVQNIKDCISIYSVDGCSKIPLFHGTRMYALEVSENDRERFYGACDRIISFAKKLVWNRPVDETILGEYLRTKNPLFLGSVVSQYKTAAYEYDSFYVTTSYPNAITFANNCGGELGQYAYAQCIGFRDFEIELDEETRAAATIVLEEHKKYENSEKVVLVFSDVRYADLKTDRGSPVFAYDENGNPNEVHNAHMIDMLYDTKVTDTSESLCSYRLQNYESYTAYMIHQNDFKKGFSLFTEIRDIDKYLKNSYSKCLRELL